MHLDGVGRDRLGPTFRGASNTGTSFIDSGGLGVELKELLEIKLGALQDLDLVDKDILKGIDGLAALLDFLSNRVGNEFLNDLLQVARDDFAVDDLKHALANGADLAALSISSLLDLLRAALSEANSEEAEEVTISGLHINVGLNGGLPLLNHRTELVGGDGHSVEVGQAVLSLDLINAETELAESLVLGFGVQVTETDFKDTSTKRVISILQTLGTVNQGLTDIADGKGGRSLNVVPILAGKGINAKYD